MASWTYPLWLPDFNNRIDNQKSLIVWMDQYVPYSAEEAKPGIIFNPGFALQLRETTEQFL